MNLNPEIAAALFPWFAFALGAIIGSFLNVVIYRLPRADEGLSIARPAFSRCPKCGTRIRWYDNIPLVSYFLLVGKCRACKTKISLRYFVVELLTAVLFGGLALRLPPVPRPADLGLFAVEAALFAALVAVTFIDIDLMIIPDKIDIPGIVLAPLLSFAVPALHLGHGDLETLRIQLAALDPIAAPRLHAVACSALGIVAGGGVIWLVGVLGTLAFKKDAMGFGDVKLLAMIGGYVGWKGVLLALFAGCLAGAVIGVGIKLVTKDSYIPFGPFLALGAVVVVLWRPEVMTFMFETWPRILRGYAR